MPRMMAMVRVPVSREVRRRLLERGRAGMSHNQIIEGMLDDIEREGFVGQMRREIDQVQDWVDLEDLRA